VYTISRQNGSRRTRLISEWDVITDNTPIDRINQKNIKAGALVTRRKAQKGRPQMLMYGNVDYPKDIFTYKNAGPNEICPDECGFRDKYFTVEDFDKLCIQHCGDIDSILEARAKYSKANVQLASRATQQLLAAKATSKLDQNFHASGYFPVNGNGNKLSQNGVTLDAWPQGKEKAMPEQYDNENPLQFQFYQHFFDTGSRLAQSGVNVKKNPLADEIKGDDKHFAKAGVNLYSWPWEYGSNPPGEGKKLPGVKV